MRKSKFLGIKFDYYLVPKKGGGNGKENQYMFLKFS